MKRDNFERELPAGYKQVLHIDAKDKRVGIIMNLAALGVTAAVAGTFAAVQVLVKGEFSLGNKPWILFLFLPIYISYIILHELTHGAAYKLTTGEKLTFGITLSVAFCGVPNIYVKRRASIFAAAAPLVLFTLIFGTLTAVFFFISTPLYILFALVFASHLGGCVGDIYSVLLLLFKYRGENTLVRDTGPEQNIFIISEEIK